MIAALNKEIELSSLQDRSENNDKNEIIDTIYFGGGTPSILTGTEINSLLASLKNYYLINDTAEITLEANPDDIDKTKLAEWKEAGINRLSIGIQSFKEADLEWMNRAHNNKQALECILLAREQGYNNLSADLIYGTPGLTDKEWKLNVEKLTALDIPHIACYALTVEPNTALKKMISLKKKENINTDQQARQFLLLMKWLNEKGYEHYEISNFAKPGFRSKHNSSYWEGKNYLGIGPSAHSYNGLKRKWNIANNSVYIQSIQKNIIPSEEEKLTEVQKLNEYIMISLRTMEGLDLNIIKNRFSHKEGTRIKLTAKKYISTGQAVFHNEKLQLSNEGKLFADGIAADLFA